VAPTTTGQAVTVYLDANGDASLSVFDVDNGSSDACGITTMHVSDSTFTCADLGANTILFTAQDASGNTRTVPVVVTVADVIAPTIVAKNIQVALGANGQVTVQGSDLVQSYTDNCSVTFTVSQGTYSCSELGAHLVTVTATDASGNTGTAQAIVTVMDQTAPNLNAQNATIYLNASGVASLSVSQITSGITDNCTVVGSSVSQSTFNQSHLGQNTITLSATDQSGNTAYGQVTVTVLDTVRPVANSQNVTVYLSNMGTASVTATQVNNGSFDNVSGLTLSVSPSFFNASNLGVNWVTLTAADASGNQDTSMATVTVLDTIRPTVLALPTTLYLDANGSASLTASTLNGGSWDNAGTLALTISKSTFACADLGSNTVVLTGTDASGNSRSVNVQVQVLDNIKPTLLTKNATVYLDATGQAQVTPSMIDNGSFDNCSLTLQVSDTVLTCSDLGMNTVLLMGTDASGNFRALGATVTVMDTLLPSVQFSQDTIQAYAGAGCAATISWSITASDNCAASVSTNHANNSLFPYGMHTVVATALDASGNMNYDTLWVEVRDTVAPVFTQQALIGTITPSGTGCGATVTWTSPVAVDACSNVAIASNFGSGSYFGAGTHTVTITASDDDGNTPTTTLTFTVVDQVNPQITLPTAMQVSNDPGVCGALVALPIIQATDNCGLDTAYYNVPSGYVFPVGTTAVMITAIDMSGNSASGSFNVTVVDTEAPVFGTAPSTVVLGWCQASYAFAMPTATDNCGVLSVTQIQGVSSGSLFPVGTTTNVFVATDMNGNTDTTSFDVVVVAAYPPALATVVALCQNDAPFDLTGGLSTVTFTGNYVTGNVFDPSLSGPGTHTVVWSFTDSLGCMSSGLTTVTVDPAPTKPMVTRLSPTYLTTQPNHQYQWFRNGTLLPGETNQHVFALTAGVYKVKVWNNLGCASMSEGFMVGSVGLDDDMAQTLRIYPNPSQGLFTLDLTQLEASETVSMQIVDVTGRVIRHRELQGGQEHRLDLTDCAQGLYQVVLRDKVGQVITKRVTVQK